jgi:hypothetical protein
MKSLKWYEFLFALHNWSMGVVSGLLLVQINHGLDRDGFW